MNTGVVARVSAANERAGAGDEDGDSDGGGGNGSGSKFGDVGGGGRCSGLHLYRRNPARGQGRPADSPFRGHLWLPDGVKTLRGLLLAGKIMLEPRICRDPQVRAACAGKGMGILYFESHFAGIFNYANTRCAEELEKQNQTQWVMIRMQMIER